MMIVLAFPDLPPSVNKAIAIRRAGNTNKRFIGKTDAYIRWIENAAWLVLSQRKGQSIAGPVQVSITARRDNPAADIDNRIKATLDAVAKGGAIQDDNQVQRVIAEWSSDADNGLTVIVTPFAKSAGLAGGIAA